MKLYRKYFDEDKEEEIEINEAIKKLEGGGYYKPGTVKDMLLAGDKLKTNSAYYYERN